MAMHSHHDLVGHEVDAQAGHTHVRTWRVSLSLLATLLGGALLINSLVAEFIFRTDKGL